MRDCASLARHREPGAVYIHCTCRFAAPDSDALLACARLRVLHDLPAHLPSAPLIALVFFSATKPSIPWRIRSAGVLSDTSVLQGARRIGDETITVVGFRNAIAIRFDQC